MPNTTVRSGEDPFYEFSFDWDALYALHEHYGETEKLEDEMRRIVSKENLVIVRQAFNDANKFRIHCRHAHESWLNKQ